MKKPWKREYFFRAPQKSCFFVFLVGPCSNLGPKVPFWTDLWFLGGPEMGPEICLGALKVGQRSSSLSWTVQINRNRSRPVDNLIDFYDFFAPSSIFMSFGLILGWCWHDFWMVFEWMFMNFGSAESMIFHICTHTYAYIHTHTHTHTYTHTHTA